MQPKGIGINWGLFDPLSWVCVLIGAVTMSACAWWTMSHTDSKEAAESYREFMVALSGKNISPKPSSKGNTLPICISEGQK